MTPRLNLWLLLLIAAALPSASVLAEQQPLPQVLTTPASTIRYAEETCGSPAQPIAFSPSGLLVMGCESGKAKVVHALTGQLLWETPPLPKLSWLSYADASTLVAISRDGQVVVFDAASHKERLRLTLPDSDLIMDIKVAGATLLVTTANRAKGVDLKALSLTDGAPLSKVTVKGVVQAATLSSDGLHAAWAIAGEPAPTLAWAPVKSLDKQTATASLCGPSQGDDEVDDLQAFALQLSPDGATVAAYLYADETSYACFVPLKDPTRARRFSPEGLSDYPLIAALQLSTDGARLRMITGGGAQDREGYSWGGLYSATIDVTTGEALEATARDAWQYDPHVMALPDGQAVWALSFHENGPPISALLTPGSSRPLRYLPHSDLDTSDRGFYGMSVGPDARTVVIHDHQRAVLLNGADPKRPTTQAPLTLTWNGLEASDVRAHVFSDGAGGAYAVIIESETLTRWELGKPEPTTTYTAPAYILRVDAGAAPDEVITCHASDKQAVFSVLNTRTGAATALADAPKLPTCPTGGEVGADTDRFLISTSYPNVSASVLNRKGEAVATQNLERYASQLSMSPNGQHILIDPPESVAMILRADTFAPVLTLEQDDINAFAFSADSQWLAVSQAETGLISLIHLPSLTTTALKSPSLVEALAFAPDSATLYSLHPKAHSVLTWALPKP